MVNLGRPRNPTTNTDKVLPRTTQMDIREAMKQSRVKRRRRYEASMVVQCTFTLTPEMDQQINDLAVLRNVSRSAIVRQALMFYLAERAES